jgi:hypothetical protein
MRTMSSLQGVEGYVLPFWIGDTLSPTTVGYAVALALVGAVVAGVLPGLKVTGRRGPARLQQLAGRGSGARMGRLWGGVIVTQVALTALLIPIAAVFGLQLWQMRTAGPGLPAAEYLSVRLEMDGDPSLWEAYRATRSTAIEKTAGHAAFLARYERSYRELERRLAAEPGVRGVTVATRIPGPWHQRRRLEVDAPVDSARAEQRSWAQVAFVDQHYFRVMGAPLLAGRAFGAADLRADARAVVVNESFVREHLGGRNAVGRQLRFRDPVWRDGSYTSEESVGPWHEIVGVVRDVPMTINPEMPHNAGIYHPLAPADAYPLWMAVRLSGEPAAFTARLRALATAADPTLRLHDPRPLDEVARDGLVPFDAWFRVLVIACAVALFLTNAGVFATMSFTVSRRTREIGVRVALGADRRQIAAALLSRTAVQVAIGVLIGAAIGLTFAYGFASEFEDRVTPTPWTAALLLAYLALMTVVCMLACVVPARRALRIEPTQAIAADG